jgi:predicted transcriptional regulator
MYILTLKIPPQLHAALKQASQREQLPRSELARRALDVYLSCAKARAAAVPPGADELRR